MLRAQSSLALNSCISKRCIFPDSQPCKQKQTEMMILWQSWPLKYNREPNLYGLINASYSCMPYFLPLHRCNWIPTERNTTAQVTGILGGWSTLHPKSVHCVSYLSYSLQGVQRTLLSWGAHRYGQLKRVFFLKSEPCGYSAPDMTLSPNLHPNCTLRGLVCLISLQQTKFDCKELGHHLSHRHLQDHDPVWTQQSHWGLYFSQWEQERTHFH